MDALRFFGMSDFREIDRMTFREHRLRMKAHNLRILDEEYLISYQAWQNREVSAQKKKGKHKTEAVYKDFEKFFNHHEREMEILYGIKKEESKTVSRAKEIMRKQHGQL